MDRDDIASEEEVDWTELEMPAAPDAASSRRFYQDWPMEKIRRNGISFALFAVAILLSVWAIGLFTEGLLMKKEDPELRERHDKFKALSGFDGLSTDGSGVDVCIVDTGIDLTHPDLAHLDLGGWKDFVHQRSSPYDDEGHGTSMAGILVARNLLPGMARGIDLHVAKAIASTGSGSSDDITNAIDWCVDRDVDIISLSLGGAQSVDLIIIETDELRAAVNRALDVGIFVVAAAGNDGGPDDDGDVASPGSVEGVICVGAIDVDGEIWGNSSVGDNGLQVGLLFLRPPRDDPDKKPELVAPGEKLAVLNAQIGGTTAKYAWGSGTSGATVWVSAAIAHLLEARPDLQHDGTAGGRSTIEEVKVWIQNSVIPAEGQSGHDDYYGYGRLRADALLEQAGQG
jgi:serine protease AprX